MNDVNIKKVLFVCVENSCRSQLAEAISNHLFSNHLKAFSAGSKPSGKVNQKAIASLKAIGIAHKGKSKSICSSYIHTNCNSNQFSFLFSN